MYFLKYYQGSGKVKENEIGSSPLRLHAADDDTPKSRAWRARYTIQGDEGQHFQIKTDPDTNDGVLTVVKVSDHKSRLNVTLTWMSRKDSGWMFVIVPLENGVMVTSNFNLISSLLCKNT